MKPFKLFAILVFLSLTGCGTLEIGIERGQPATATAINQPAAATATGLPIAPPTATAPDALPSPTVASLSPTDPPPAPTAILTEPTTTSGPQFVKIILIAIDDNGQSGQLIGCGDSAIPVDVEIDSTKEVLRASLEKLLSIKDQFYGQSGLYNALYQSDLQLDSLSLENGTAVVNLTGTLTLGGECDNPRVQAQLESTVLQFSTVQQASIFINGRPLKDVLSLK